MAIALLLPLALSGQEQPISGVPNAPAPQSSNSVSALAAGVAPGEASSSASDAANPGQPSADENGPAPGSATAPEGNVQTAPPVVIGPGQMNKDLPTFTANVNYVQIPVTVLDKKHQQVAGLTWRDFQIYENGQRQPIATFSDDAVPLSVALVIDQSLSQDVMQKVNASLGAIQGAFTPSDSVAVFTYSDGVNEVTNFTAAQGARLPAVLQASKSPGAEMGVPVNSGAFAQGPHINGMPVDPNVEPGRSAGGQFIVIPKEVHTLNDAILAAAKSLSKQPHDNDRRRIIYVISDGRESRSKASYKDVVHYLQSNEIQVYGTLVGDSAVWGLGYLDKLKMPLLPLSPDNILPRYVSATGGHLASEFSEVGIQRSFAELAALGRTEYTLGYYSHIPLLNGSFRKLEVRVLRPALEVHAPPGYFPMASALLR